MAFTTGTSTDYADLLVDVGAWLVATAGYTALEDTPVTIEAKSVDSVAAGGTGYIVGEVITLTGGTFSTATTVTVATISGSAVATVTITEPGDYSVAPSDPVAQGSSDGSGTGATFNMTYGQSAGTLSLEAPGNGASARVYINIETDYSTVNNFYSWKVYGATGWASGLDHGSQQGTSIAHFLNLSNSSLDYWIYANDRRFILEVQSGVNYMNLYAGFFLPFALPSEYPFPLYISASYNAMALPGLVNARNSFCADPGSGGCATYRRRSSEIWVNLENQTSSGLSNVPATGERAYMWPHKAGRGNTSTTIVNWSGGGFANLKANFAGESPLFNCHIVDLPTNMVVGALDGVYSTSGDSRSVEQVVTIDSQDYRLFQRVFRSAPEDFMAIKEL